MVAIPTDLVAIPVKTPGSTLGLYKICNQKLGKFCIPCFGKSCSLQLTLFFVEFTADAQPSSKRRASEWSLESGN
jgi:hypothetical protein